MMRDLKLNSVGAHQCGSNRRPLKAEDAVRTSSYVLPGGGEARGLG